MTVADFSYDTTSRTVHASLEQAFRAIPPDKRGALILSGQRTDSGYLAQVMLAAKLSDGWQVAGGGSWDGQHKATGQVQVIGSW